MRNIDLTALEIFKTVAEQGGITRAAARLHRVQSNVTTRVKQLEERLGTKLFLRQHRRLVLSPDGRRLLAYADRLLRLSSEAEAALRIGAGAPTGGGSRPGSVARGWCRSASWNSARTTPSSPAWPRAQGSRSSRGRFSISRWGNGTSGCLRCPQPSGGRRRALSCGRAISRPRSTRCERSFEERTET